MKAKQSGINLPPDLSNGAAMSPVKEARARRKRIDVRTDLDKMNDLEVEKLTVLGSGGFCNASKELFNYLFSIIISKYSYFGTIFV